VGHMGTNGSHSPPRRCSLFGEDDDARLARLKTVEDEGVCSRVVFLLETACQDVC
jgi:hypothetical protein